MPPVPLPNFVGAEVTAVWCAVLLAGKPLIDEVPCGPVINERWRSGRTSRAPANLRSIFAIRRRNSASCSCRSLTCFAVSLPSVTAGTQ